jgi:hypothetical protein
MKCKIFTYTVYEIQGNEIEKRISKFLVAEVDKIISITQSQVGQGTVVLTIIYHEHKA